jgi:para-nitrobenzyl esterase
LYYFTRTAPGNKEETEQGAFHSAEVPYAYHNLDKWQRPWTEKDIYLQETLSSYFVNFIASGNPNGEALPMWPRFGHDLNETLEVGDSIRIIDVPGSEEFLHFNNAFHR